MKRGGVDETDAADVVRASAQDLPGQDAEALLLQALGRGRTLAAGILVAAAAGSLSACSRHGGQRHSTGQHACGGHAKKSRSCATENVIVG